MMRFTKNNLIWVVISVLFVLPLIAYTNTFGIGIWESHDDWAKMGSTLGGIYSPFVAFLTLLLLFRQQTFVEESTKINEEKEFKRYAFSKCEEYITLASEQINKLSEQDRKCLNKLLIDYSVELDENKKKLIFANLTEKYRPQVSSLTRAGTTINHMKKSDIQLSGQITDLRVYASSLIDVDLLISHDELQRIFGKDTSYHSFVPSKEELERIERLGEEYRKKHC